MRVAQTKQWGIKVPQGFSLGRGHPGSDDVTHGRSQCLGACVNTGHFFRSGQSPAEVIPRLGHRVHAVHVKDFVDSDTEAVSGRGQLDLTELVHLLEKHTVLTNPLVLEYEADPVNPTPAVKETLELLRQA